MKPPRVFLPAILSGLMLWTAFFPLDWGPVAFVALVPWLTLVRAEGVSRKRRYTAAFVGGVAFYLPALQWIRVAHPAMYASYAFLVVYCSLHFVVALFLLRRIDRLGKIPLAFSLPIVWVALDYSRTHFPTGFPVMQHLGMHHLIGFGWYMLGYTQHSTPQLVQLASLGGVYLLTTLICAFNGAAFEWVVRQPWLRRSLFRYPTDTRVGFFREMWASALVMITLALSVGYGTQALLHPDYAEGPRVAALQGSIPQDVKMDNEDELFARYQKLNNDAGVKPDLIIWPETCCPYSWYDSAVENPGSKVREFLRDQRQEFYERTANPKAVNIFKRNTLIGATTYEWDGAKWWRYNSALLFTPRGEYVNRYDKIHLVPFGEYVPLGGIFPFMQSFTPYKGDYSCKPGERFTKFPLQVGSKTYTFGVIICYEDSEPWLARQYVKSEPVDFLVNISNDGWFIGDRDPVLKALRSVSDKIPFTRNRHWFHGTEEHEQHLAICKFRAVECRRYIVRAVNSGISAIINSDGVEVGLPHDSWDESKRMEGVVWSHDKAKIKLDTRTSFYAQAGDWLPALCWLIILGVIVPPVIRGTVKKLASRRPADTPPSAISSPKT